MTAAQVTVAGEIAPPAAVAEPCVTATRRVTRLYFFQKACMTLTHGFAQLRIHAQAARLVSSSELKERPCLA
jgi:hypothetical protein